MIDGGILIRESEVLEGRVITSDIDLREKNFSYGLLFFRNSQRLPRKAKTNKSAKP